MGWRSASTVKDISDFFVSNVNWMMYWVSRQANHAVVWVTKQAAKKMCPFDWVRPPHLRWPPSCLSI